jgi:hypothetical protein
VPDRSTSLITIAGLWDGVPIAMFLFPFKL